MKENPLLEKNIIIINGEERTKTQQRLTFFLYKYPADGNRHTINRFSSASIEKTQWEIRRNFNFKKASEDVRRFGGSVYRRRKCEGERNGGSDEEERPRFQRFQRFVSRSPPWISRKQSLSSTYQLRCFWSRWFASQL